MNIIISSQFLLRRMKKRLLLLVRLGNIVFSFLVPSYKLFNELNKNIAKFKKNCFRFNILRTFNWLPSFKIKNYFNTYHFLIINAPYKRKYTNNINSVFLYSLLYLIFFYLYLYYFHL